MRVVVGCPVAERAWVLPRWFDALQSQSVQVDIVCLYGESIDSTYDILIARGAAVLRGDNVPVRDARHLYEHVWDYTAGDYEMMARLRNTLLDAVRLGPAPDYFFSLDSDIILSDRYAVEKLIDTLRDREVHAVAPLVNMTAPLGVPVTPPAMYNYMYKDAVGDLFDGNERSSPPSEPFPVGAIMGAMLLDTVAQRVMWENHPQGEDLGWSLNARNAGIIPWIDPNVVCPHLMNHRYA